MISTWTSDKSSHCHTARNMARLHTEISSSRRIDIKSKLSRNQQLPLVPAEKRCPAKPICNTRLFHQSIRPLINYVSYTTMSCDHSLTEMQTHSVPDSSHIAHFLTQIRACIKAILSKRKTWLKQSNLDKLLFGVLELSANTHIKN